MRRIINAILLVAGLLGAGSLKDLALALLIGLASGAYSSIFVAAPLLGIWKEREPEFARRRIEPWWLGCALLALVPNQRPLRELTIDGRSIDCSFATIAQCAATASGQSAQCYANPYATQSRQLSPVPSPPRRSR